MGRSVSTPRNAVVAYATPVFAEDALHAAREENPDVDFEDVEYDYFDGDDFIECARQNAMRLWPSMQVCDSWLDREDHAIAENSWAYFGVSEYCGLVAYWLAPKDQDNSGREAMRDNWIATANTKLQSTFGELRKVAVFSNGEAMFERRS